MRYVKSFDEMIENLVYWDKLRSNPDRQSLNAYEKLVKGGYQFFTYPSSKGLAFVPARILGNAGYNIKTPPSELKDGGNAVLKINSILEFDGETDEFLDKIYIDHCRALGVKERQLQTHDRKFWKFEKLSSEFQNQLLEAIYGVTNQIVYGPPGTGKTFGTAYKALEICLGKSVAKLMKDKNEIMNEYQHLIDKGQIEFVTFHQSFSYQEFVEGLRPITPNIDNQERTSGFNIQVHEGIFKRICSRAKNEGQKFRLNPDNSIYQFCIDNYTSQTNRIEKYLNNSTISIGSSMNFDLTDIELKGLDEFDKVWNENVSKNASFDDEISNTKGDYQIYEFRYEAKVGDYVVLLDGAEKFVAVGEITGPYIYDQHERSEPHFRSMNWLWSTSVGRPHSEIYSKKFQNKLFCKLEGEDVDWEGIEQIIGEEQSSGKDVTNILENLPKTGRGRFSGKLLKPRIDYNPRKKYSKGWYSFEILLMHSEYGIMYEDFIRNEYNIGGEDVVGRRLDLQRDFDMDRVTVMTPPSTITHNRNTQNFVLIIDEINRANISKVFGELITLLEVDKRLGESNEIQVILPYSGEKFGVPRNLYIIGTMNTADRSIALIDTALRRRFKFEELMPKDELIPVNIKIGNGTLRDLFVRINDRIEYLFDREHTIGHAYFMNCKTEKDVSKVFNDRVIPLLSEYFYNDRSKIAEVLEDEIPEDSTEEFDGCFLSAKHISNKGLRPQYQGTELEPKLRWIVNSEFKYDKLKQLP